jgi:hypothetical protein
LYEFKILSVQGQHTLLSSLEPVATRSESDYLYELYQIEDFYGEVKLGFQSKIIRTFKTMELLQPYLEDIIFPKVYLNTSYHYSFDLRVSSPKQVMDGE